MAGWIVPVMLGTVALYGLAKKTDVFDGLTVGIEKGGRTMLRIFPSLVGLLTAVYMLRASGTLDLLSLCLAPLLQRLGIPPETTALLLIRPVSGSGALAVGSELMQRYGVDSPIGRTAAVMLGCTETTFYTVTVYFGAAGIRRSRYAVPAALVADAVGFFGAALCVRWLM